MDRDQAVPITENVAEPLECSPEVEVEDSGYSRTLQVHTSKYSGPIPPPETLEGYERLLPGAAERILTMAEQNAATIRDINTKQAAAEESTERNRHDETTSRDSWWVVVKLRDRVAHVFSLVSYGWCLMEKFTEKPMA